MQQWVVAAAGGEAAGCAAPGRARTAPGSPSPAGRAAAGAIVPAGPLIEDPSSLLTGSINLKAFLD